RRARAPHDIRMLELLDRAVRAVATSDDLLPFPAQGDVDRREAVQPPGELGWVDVRTGEEVDLSGAIRGGHGDLPFEIRELLLQAHRVLDRRLTVVREKNHGVALEEL